MDRYEEESQPSQQENRDRWADMQSQINRPLAAIAVALLVLLGVSAAYGLHQRAAVHDLTAQSATMNQSMAQLQSQVNTLNTQLQGMKASQDQAQPQSAPRASEETIPETPASVAESPVLSAPAAVAPGAKPAPKKHAVKRSPATDKRYAQLQAQLAEQQKELKDTQQQMEKYRSDMEGNITSTRTELSGEIAKNHDELVVLEKKGERSYYEFELTKSKQFQRVGPVSLSLRKTDTKHKNYDFSMLVDDNELGKKKVNLYEPVVIHAENNAQPVQIVVNHIDKNVVRGYVSAPKYKPAELTPASVNAPNPADSASQAAVHGPQQPQ
jgi:hypothetical protein